MIKQYLLLLLLPVAVCAEQHVAWQLEGAQERIENYRMGDCSLELRLADGLTLPVGTKVSLEQTGHAFYFGGSLAQARTLHAHESYAAYQQRFAQLFNYATIGFYWLSHERQPNSWKLKAYAQDTMEWATAQSMTVRGHPLMWHNVAPPWIADTERAVAAIDADVMAHVRMLVEQYPEVDHWDLYNETPGIRLYPPEYGVRRWVESLGGSGPVTETIVEAVREVRPAGFFSLNHFSYADSEYHEQIEYCLDNLVEFDAIGIQSHLHTRRNRLEWTEDKMWKMLERYAKYQKPIHLSEVSVVSCEPFDGGREMQAWEARIKEARQARMACPVRLSSPSFERYQAEYTRDFYTLAFSHPSVEAIIWWSVSDRDAWRGMPAGLVDANGQPKPAYEVLDQLINHEWHTSTEVLVDTKGRVPLKGFYGTYRVKAEYQGEALTGVFELKRGQKSVPPVFLNF